MFKQSIIREITRMFARCNTNFSPNARPVRGKYLVTFTSVSQIGFKFRQYNHDSRVSLPR